MKHFLLLLLVMPIWARAHEHDHVSVRLANDLRNTLSGTEFHAAPFTLTAKVSFVGSFSNFSALVLEDKSGSIVAYLENAAAKSPPAPGDIINCSGRVDLDALKRRHAFIRQFKTIERQTPPTPASANVSELTSGAFDYRFIRLCGTVYDARSSESAPKWALLTIVHKSDIVYASIPIVPTPDWSFENLIGADITLDGIYFPRGELCLGARKHLGRTLTAYSPSALRETKPATTDLSNLPDISVLSNASAEEIPRFHRFRTDGIVIMDLMMPGLDGCETTRRLIAQDPDTKVLILTTFGTSDGITHALEVGAKGAIMKNCDFEELMTAIRTIASGKNYISAEIRRIISKDPPVAALSPRQAEILQSIVRGLSNPDIAKQLGISLDMVKEHIETLFQKIGAANRTEAVAIALRKHLLKI